MHGVENEIPADGRHAEARAECLTQRRGFGEGRQTLTAIKLAVR